jgi:hypothetical protein
MSGNSLGGFSVGMATQLAVGNRQAERFAAIPRIQR